MIRYQAPLAANSSQRTTLELCALKFFILTPVDVLSSALHETHFNIQSLYTTKPQLLLPATLLFKALYLEQDLLFLHVNLRAAET